MFYQIPYEYLTWTAEDTKLMKNLARTSARNRGSHITTFQAHGHSHRKHDHPATKVSWWSIISTHKQNKDPLHATDWIHSRNPQGSPFYHVVLQKPSPYKLRLQSRVSPVRQTPNCLHKAEDDRQCLAAEHTTSAAQKSLNGSFWSNVTPSAAALAFTSGCLPWLSFLGEEGPGLVELLLASLEHSFWVHCWVQNPIK